MPPLHTYPYVVLFHIAYPRFGNDPRGLLVVRIGPLHVMLPYAYPLFIVLFPCPQQLIGLALSLLPFWVCVLFDCLMFCFSYVSILVHELSDHNALPARIPSFRDHEKQQFMCAFSGLGTILLAR